MKRIFIALVSLFSIGCSTFSKSECQNFNWYGIGYNSANNGDLVSDQINFYQRECTKEHNVQMNQQQFQEGYNKGLEIFCSDTGGKNLGLTGGVYRGTCPKKSEETFMKSYEPARMSYLVRRVSELESLVNRLESEISSKNSRISSLESEVSTLRFRTCNP